MTWHSTQHCIFHQQSFKHVYRYQLYVINILFYIFSYKQLQNSELWHSVAFWTTSFTIYSLFFSPPGTFATADSTYQHHPDVDYNESHKQASVSFPPLHHCLNFSCTTGWDHCYVSCHAITRHKLAHCAAPLPHLPVAFAFLQFLQHSLPVSLTVPTPSVLHDFRDLARAQES